MLRIQPTSSPDQINPLYQVLDGEQHVMTFSSYDAAAFSVNAALGLYQQKQPDAEFTQARNRARIHKAARRYVGNEPKLVAAISNFFGSLVGGANGGAA